MVGEAAGVGVLFTDAPPVDTADTESLTVDDLHMVEPRAAGLDVQKMCITAAVRLYEAATDAAQAVVQ
ncbi:MAG: hypothetical protein OXG35_04290 [Acidobacteria bacterium]|nr:hypothetical protein [Acidobacteriota bacterium]